MTDATDRDAPDETGVTEDGWSPWIVEVRQRLSQPAPERMKPREARHAAVLVPLYVDAGELWTILTQRTAELPHHKSQYAFPGGARESGEGPWDAALREAEEEIGIEPPKVLRLGELDETETPSGFRIVPCVAAVPFPFQPVINEDEIAEVFNVPLSALANPRMAEERLVKIQGEEKVIRIYHVGNRRVWGLTARILQNLLARLGLETFPA